MTTPDEPAVAAVDVLTSTLDGAADLLAEEVIRGGGTLEDDPRTEDPAADEPATDEPATDEPPTENPAVDEEAIEDPRTEDPAIDEAGIDDPATEDTITDDPEIVEPATEAPAAEDGASDEPTAEEAESEAPAVEDPAPKDEPADGATEEIPRLEEDGAGLLDATFTMEVLAPKTGFPEVLPAMFMLEDEAPTNTPPLDEPVRAWLVARVDDATGAEGWGLDAAPTTMEVLLATAFPPARDDDDKVTVDVVEVVGRMFGGDVVVEVRRAGGDVVVLVEVVISVEVSVDVLGVIVTVAVVVKNDATTLGESGDVRSTGHAAAFIGATSRSVQLSKGASGKPA